MLTMATRAWVPVSPMGFPSEEGYSMPSSRSRLGFREVLVETGTLMKQAPIAGYGGDSGSMSAVPSIVTEDTGPATLDWFSSPAQLQMTTFNPFPAAAGFAEPRSRGGVVRPRPGPRVAPAPLPSRLCPVPLVPLPLPSRLYRVPLPSVSVVLLPG